MDWISQILPFVNELAGRIGASVIGVVQLFVPATEVLGHLAGPIGWLVMLTAALACVEVARKLTWLAVGLGWVLVTAWIVLAIVRS